MLTFVQVLPILSAGGGTEIVTHSTRVFDVPTWPGGIRTRADHFTTGAADRTSGVTKPAN
jgi:hypothetical protein